MKSATTLIRRQFPNRRSEPKAGEVWAAKNNPVVVILKPQGGQVYLLATLDTSRSESMSMARLKEYFRKRGFANIGAVITL